MSNNIIFNKKLEEYNKKYRNGRYKLLKYTKKEVEQYDKYANQTLKTKNHLLKGRKWALIGDTYYEIPKAPRALWFRNLNAGVKAATCALVGGAVAGGAGYGIYVAVANGKQPVKPDPGPTPVIHVPVVVKPEVEQIIEIPDFVEDESGNAVATLEAKQEGMEVVSVTASYGDHQLSEDEAYIDRQNQKYTVKQETRKMYETETCRLTLMSVSVAEVLSLELDTNKIEFTLGEAVPTLTATIRGSGGTASFSCEDTSIATVSYENNVCTINPIKAGTTKIVAKFLYLTKECQLIIKEQAEETISISPTSATLLIGDGTGKTITATTTVPGGTITFALEGRDPSSFSLTTSSVPGTAKVSINGKPTDEVQCDAVAKTTNSLGQEITARCHLKSFNADANTRIVGEICEIENKTYTADYYQCTVSVISEKQSTQKITGFSNIVVGNHTLTEDEYESEVYSENKSYILKIKKSVFQTYTGDILITPDTSEIEIEIILNPESLSLDLDTGETKDITASFNPSTISGTVVFSVEEGYEQYITINQTGNVCTVTPIKATPKDSPAKVKASFEDAKTHKSATKECPVTVTSQQIEKANVRLIVTPNSAGKVAGGKDYEKGSNVLIQATSLDGFAFDGWYETETGGEAKSPNPDFIIGNIQEDKTFYARFVEGTPEGTINITIQNAGTGRGECSGNGVHAYKSGGDVIVTATPDEDSKFDGWYDDKQLQHSVCTDQIYRISSSTITSSTLTLYAKFSPNKTQKYTISTSVDPVEAANANGGGEYDPDVSVTLSLSDEKSGFTWQGWKNNSGETVSTEKTYTFTATESIDLIATFSDDRATYNVSAEYDTEGGSVTGTGDYKAGQTATLTATEKVGYTFQGWYSDLEHQHRIEVETATYEFEVTKETIVYPYFKANEVTSLRIDNDVHYFAINSSDINISTFDQDDKLAAVTYSHDAGDKMTIDDDGKITINDTSESFVVNITATSKTHSSISSSPSEYVICTDIQYYDMDYFAANNGVLKGRTGSTVTQTTRLILPPKLYQSGSYVTANSIANSGFTNYTKVQDIYIPSTINSIGSKAFSINKLTSLKFATTSGWKYNGVDVEETDISTPEAAAAFYKEHYTGTWTHS